MSVLENTKRLIKRSAQLRTYQVGAVAAGVMKIMIGLPMAVPSVDAKVTALVNDLNESFGLGGDAIVAPREAVNQFFVGLTGVLVAFLGVLLIWSALRIITRLKVPALISIPQLVSASMIIYYVVACDVARIMLGFAFLDVGFSALFLYCYSRLKHKV